nr:DUF4390 domain-containing protein [Methylogaea oryzae]
MAKGLLALALLFNTALGWAASAEFTVLDARLQLQKDGYSLSADIDYRLPPAVREALGNSVPITLVVQLKVKRERRLLWEETVLNEYVRYRLRYHALSKLYQIQQEGIGGSRNFATLDAAVQALGSIRQLSIASADRFMLGITYKAGVRATWISKPCPCRCARWPI